LTLLSLTVLLAYTPIGQLHLASALAIASLKTLIVAAVFMELRRRSGLVIAFAGAGAFWLAILMWLALSDFLTRPVSPARALADPRSSLSESHRAQEGERGLTRVEPGVLHDDRNIRFKHRGIIGVARHRRRLGEIVEAQVHRAPRWHRDAIRSDRIAVGKKQQDRDMSRLF
jgi:caa(3)-type oxidase subunit IV